MIKHEFTEDTGLTIYLTGHIDTANAPEIEKEILDISSSTPHDTLIIDMADLTYISSVGLRIMLKLKKSEKDMKIVNVSSEVYEIFDMTGFTEIIQIEKAYRNLSVDGCEKIGEGANGKVYRINKDTILKVYENGASSLEDIKRERELARAAFILGVPTAISYDVVKVDGKYFGSVFELIDAKSLANLLVSGEISLEKAAEVSTDLLKIIHSKEITNDTIPSAKNNAKEWITYIKYYIPDNEYAKLLSLIDEVPECQNMIHGDYHIKNIMLQDNESILIDMDTMSTGSPLFEFVSMYYTYMLSSEYNHDDAINFFGIPRSSTEYLWNTIMKLYYSDKSDEYVESVKEKAMLLTYVRGLRRLIRTGKVQTEKGKEEAKLFKSHITELLSKVDSLII